MLPELAACAYLGALDSALRHMRKGSLQHTCHFQRRDGFLSEALSFIACTSRSDASREYDVRAVDIRKGSSYSKQTSHWPRCVGHAWFMSRFPKRFLLWAELDRPKSYPP